MMTSQDNESIENNRTSESEKCYVYYNSPTFDNGGTIKSLSLVTFQGIECLKGISVSKWDKGRVVYIPVRHVYMLIEFDSFEDWQKAKNTQKKRYHGGILGRIVRKFK
jgi:hypothetical protein